MIIRSNISPVVLISSYLHNTAYKHMIKHVSKETYHRCLLHWANPVIHSLATQSSIILTLRYNFLPGLWVPTRNTPRFASWNLASSWCQPVNHQTPRLLSPANVSKSIGDAPGYGRTWAHLIAFSRCDLFFFRKLLPASWKHKRKYTRSAQLY